MTFELSKETQQKLQNIVLTVFILGLVALVVGFLVAIYKPKDSDDGDKQSPQMMMNSTQPQSSPYKYIPLLDKEGNMTTGTFQDLLNLMAESKENVVFPSNVTFSQGATVEGDVNFKNTVNFKNFVRLSGGAAFHKDVMFHGLLKAKHIKTDKVETLGPKKNLKLKGKAITLLSEHQDLNKDIEGKNIMLQTISGDKALDEDGRSKDKVFIPKRTGIGHLNRYERTTDEEATIGRDSLQVGQGHWDYVANGKRIKLDNNGIVTEGRADEYFWTNWANEYGG